MTDTEAQRRLERVIEETQERWQDRDPPIERITAELGEDQEGQPSAFFVVVMPARTDDSDWTPQRLDPIASLIKESSRARDLGRWVYVEFARSGDDADPVEEAGDDAAG